jgi:peptidoglycan/LPS O-acetylase OafA/YrhL
MSAALSLPTLDCRPLLVGREPSTPETRHQRIPSLDGLRAISISVVVVSHLAKWRHVSLPILGTYGELGVHVFFVLSGYLITNLLLDEYRRTSTVCISDFYLRRAFRIFPAALVFLSIVVVIYWRQMRWYHVGAALFYLANMDLARPWIFGHLWSLSIEEQFYLIWPFAVKRWHRHKTAILISVLIVTPLFRAALYALKINNGLVGSLPIFADQLAIGCFLSLRSLTACRRSADVYKDCGTLALRRLVPTIYSVNPTASNCQNVIF